MIRKIVVILSMFFLISISGFAHASIINDGPELEYWNSNGPRIGHDFNRRVWRGLLGGPYTNFPFHLSIHFARTEWASAGLNSSLQSDISKPNASISCYGGDFATLKAREPGLRSIDAGLTRWVNLHHYINYSYRQANGSMINIAGYRLLYSNVYVVCQPGKTDRHYQSVATHELGHAFGYFGHSSFTSDVMFGTVRNPPNIYLNQREINHLLQVYR